MFVCDFDFTPESIGYIYGKEVANLVNIPLKFGGISYRCTCLSCQGKSYCVIPFRRVTDELAAKMSLLVSEVSFFEKKIVTVVAQIIDRHNIIVKAYNSGSIVDDAEMVMCVSVGALRQMRFVDTEVWVEYNDEEGRVLIDSEGKAILQIK